MISFFNFETPQVISPQLVPPGKEIVEAKVAPESSSELSDTSFNNNLAEKWSPT